MKHRKQSEMYKNRERSVLKKKKRVHSQHYKLLLKNHWSLCRKLALDAHAAQISLQMIGKNQVGKSFRVLYTCCQHRFHRDTVPSASCPLLSTYTLSILTTAYRTLYIRLEMRSWEHWETRQFCHQMFVGASVKPVSNTWE